MEFTFLPLINTLTSLIAVPAAVYLSLYWYLINIPNRKYFLISILIAPNVATENMLPKIIGYCQKAILFEAEILLKKYA